MSKQRICHLVVIRRKSVLAFKGEKFDTTVRVNLKASDNPNSIASELYPLKDAVIRELGRFNITVNGKVTQHLIYITTIKNLDPLPMHFLRDKEVLSRDQLEELSAEQMASKPLTKTVKLLVSSGII